MLIEKLQLPKIPDSLEAALEYLGAERWVCWYWDDEGTLLLEDINSSYFGNSQAWLLFCSFIDANQKVDKDSSYDYFQSLVSGQYSYDEAHEAEAEVTQNLSLSNNQEGYLFDRQNRELYSGSPSNIQTLIKQPKTLVMWAELQGQTRNNIGFEEELSEPSPTIETIDDWALTKVLLKLVVVWFGVAVILPVPWASAINIPQSISRFLFSPPFNSLEVEKLDAQVDKLILKEQVAELSRRPKPLRVIKKQKSECGLPSRSKP